MPSLPSPSMLLLVVVTLRHPDLIIPMVIPFTPAPNASGSHQFGSSSSSEQTPGRRRAIGDIWLAVILLSLVVLLMSLLPSTHSHCCWRLRHPLFPYSYPSFRYAICSRTVVGDSALLLHGVCSVHGMLISASVPTIIIPAVDGVPLPAQALNN